MNSKNTKLTRHGKGSVVIMLILIPFSEIFYIRFIAIFSTKFTCDRKKEGEG